jgi:lipopolysaccharide/colanic/teichoic acid biosynthesis glycosyltransferase
LAPTDNILTKLFIVFINIGLIKAGYLISFWFRYGYPFPEENYLPYRDSYLYLILIHLLSLSLWGAYQSRFKTSWDLFTRVFGGLFVGTLFSIAFIYIFRTKWGAFPTTIFAISLFVNLLLIFKFNQIILKHGGKIKKRILVIGQEDIEDIITGKSEIKRARMEDIKAPQKYPDIDEMIICGEIPSEKDMGFIACLAQKLKAEIIYSPTCYVRLLSEKINGNGIAYPMATFFGKKRDVDEFLMRSLDVLGSVIILFVSLPVILLVLILIKLTSRGPGIYTQERVGKDGRIFTLYKLRTMTQDAEKHSGPVLASENDPRVTKIGRFLRETRLDEFPQLVNVLLGQMSLVGPRPERPYFVKHHKALMEIRLSIKPGLTGLAQVEKDYDLHPRHKIKYDCLYIQRRSLLLNLYLLAKTIPVVLLKKGT